MEISDRKSRNFLTFSPKKVFLIFRETELSSQLREFSELET